jgi:hypothetical protein
LWWQASHFERKWWQLRRLPLIETPSENGGFEFEEMSGCIGIEALFDAFDATSEFRRLST